jgi:hypothetical protein
MGKMRVPKNMKSPATMESESPKFLEIPSDNGKNESSKEHEIPSDNGK